VRHIPLCAAVLAAGGLFLTSLMYAQIQDSARVPIKEIGHYEIVEVRLNDTGPYNFVFDTGTNTTLVRRELLELLNAPAAGRVGFNSTTNAGFRQRAILDQASVGGASVDHLAVTSLEPGDFPDLGAGVMGILGEDFLKHFDLLIDNQQSLLMLDGTPDLAEAAEGERLPLVRFGRIRTSWTPNRLVVELRIPSAAGRPLQFLVDSGVNEVMLFQSPELTQPFARGGRSATMHGMTGNRACAAQIMTVELGSTRMSQMNVIECPGLTRNRTDADGLIPTRSFSRLFLSYRQGYMIANPVIREQPSLPMVQLAREN
jgi:hypothetical protein